MNSTRSWMSTLCLTITHGCCDTARPRTTNSPQKQFELGGLFQDHRPIFRNSPFMRRGLSRMPMSDRLGLHPETG